MILVYNEWPRVNLKQNMKFATLPFACSRPRTVSRATRTLTDTVIICMVLWVPYTYGTSTWRVKYLREISTFYETECIPHQLATPVIATYITKSVCSIVLLSPCQLFMTSSFRLKEPHNSSCMHSVNHMNHPIDRALHELPEFIQRSTAVCVMAYRGNDYSDQFSLLCIQHVH